jgi:tetratricopeptide (TPR) repeat protein
MPTVDDLEDGSSLAATSGWRSRVGHEDPTVHGDVKSTRSILLPRGTPLGRYVILEPLGSGGLGDVYTAYDPQLDRRVAIKLLRPVAAAYEDSHGSSSTGGRLLREAQAMAKLSHPNVVTVHDVGTVNDEVFIAMELVDGVTLHEWMKRPDLDWRTIRDVFVGAGRGLAAAHAQGLVHRDFKPTNVLLTFDQQDQPGRACVLDFGLARSVQGRIAESRPTDVPTAAPTPSDRASLLHTDLTMEGTVMGTPAYMAPEQFDGGSVGPAADQFSFCVALWLALYGQRPFMAERVKDFAPLVKAGRITEPTDRRGVPSWLHRVLLRGLATEPTARHSSMEALLHALLRDRRSRKRQWVVLAACIVLAPIGTVAGMMLTRPEASAEQHGVVETLTNDARAAAAKAYFVYPPAEQHDYPTAYIKVRELEAQEGPIGRIASRRAGLLREEFVETLLRLGDKYYDHPAGVAFAADYYAAALIFDPDNDHARSRMSLTPGELATLRDKAASGDFTEAELVAAASLAILAEPDEGERIRRIESLYANARGLSPSTSARLESLLGVEETKAIERVAQRTAKNRPRAEPDPVPDPDPVPEPEPEPELEPEPEPTVDAPAKSDDTPRRDPAVAKALASQGLAALRKGQLKEAEALLHRALGSQSNNAQALGGLAELHFERGAYHKAVQYGRAAVAAAPRNADHRMVLGDAYFKILSYESARREYEKAKELGHSAATRRLGQLEAKLGE